MTFRWFGFKRRPRPVGTLKAIYLASSAGAPMRSVSSVETIGNRGLDGDRYARDAGHWKSVDGCQATLITDHDLARAKKRANAEIKLELDRGGHRRNLVIAGVKTKALEGREFRIGSVVFRHDKPRPPCGYLDQVSTPGTCRALGRHSGVCIRVVTSGTISVGDTVEILEQA